MTPAGAKYWRYKFRIRLGAVRKEKRLALGVYREVSLNKAREDHALARRQVASGEDPTQLKRKQHREKESVRVHRDLAALFGRCIFGPKKESVISRY